MNLPNPQKPITPEGEKLLFLIQKLNYGELRVIVQNGKPIRAENIIQSIKLDIPDDEFKEKLRTISLLP